jgi:transcriptional regulator with XRE-family HTH domain
MKDGRRIGFALVKFNADIRRICKDREMSLRGMAEETGVREDTIYYMQCKGSVPDGTALAALCKWSGLKIGDYSIDLLERKK